MRRDCVDCGRPLPAVRKKGAVRKLCTPCRKVHVKHHNRVGQQRHREKDRAAHNAYHRQWMADYRKRKKDAM